MTRQTTEALIAESRKVARQYDPAFRLVLTRVIDRLEVVAKDSSTGQQMHSYWQRRAEDAEREMHARELHHFEEEERSAALAAVVEKVRGQVEHTMHPERYKARCGVCRIESTLATAPADALREVKAEVWEEGFDAGERDVMGHETFDESCIENPYREEQDRG